MSALLELSGVNARYGATQALFDVNLTVESGGITALLGANGAGKTTTLRALCAMVKATGSVKFEGSEISQLTTEAIARRGIAHVPDGRGTYLDLSVDENLRLGGYLIREKVQYERSLDLVLAYFPKLKERFRQQAGTLSGGEQQMLAISRALMPKPRLMVLDEPSFGLAPLVVRSIFDIMRRINKEEGVGILLVEQNAKQALSLSTHAYLMETGRVVASGTAEQMQNNDEVRRVYLGN